MLSIYLKTDSVRIYIIVSCLGFTSNSTFIEHFVSWHFLLKFCERTQFCPAFKGKKMPLQWSFTLTNKVLRLFSRSAF